MSFQDAFVKLIQHEGHYSNLVTDKGGETAWGLSKRSYPSLDMKTLTMNQAGEIYKRDFWDKLGCDEFVSEKLAFQVFDAAVNSGIFQATKWLQRSVNSHADGILEAFDHYNFFDACNSQRENSWGQSKVPE